MIAIHGKTLISAQVMLNSESCIREVDKQMCEIFFREAGFELGYRFADSFSVSASVKNFELVFDCLIAIDDYGTHIDSDSEIIKYELPLESLSGSVRNCVKAVTFSVPPDFGPGNF